MYKVFGRSFFFFNWVVQFRLFVWEKGMFESIVHCSSQWTHKLKGSYIYIYKDKVYLYLHQSLAGYKCLKLLPFLHIVAQITYYLFTLLFPLWFLHERFYSKSIPLEPVVIVNQDISLVITFQVVGRKTEASFLLVTCQFLTTAQ